MMRKIVVSLLMLAGSWVLNADAQNARVSLVSEYETIQPGKDFYLGLQFDLDDGWHIYWKNPGDSGLSPRAEWSAQPKGTVFGELEFPHPQKIPFGSLTNYGYSNATVLLVKVSPAETLKDGQDLSIEGKIKWLVCKEECKPEEAVLKLQLPVSLQAPVNPSGIIQKALKDIPSKKLNELRVSHDKNADGSGVISLVWPVQGSSTKDVYFFSSEEIGTNYSEVQKVSRDGDHYRLTLHQKKYTPFAKLAGILKMNSTTFFDVQEVLNAHLFSIEKTPSAGFTSWSQLGIMILFAILGGLILNLMPCVLPILSIKTLGLIQYSSLDSKEVRKQGLIYSLGILSSFWLLTLLLVVLKHTGMQLGWGFQLQYPAFIGVLALLFFLMALNLLGVFEISGKWMGAGSELTAKEGSAGSFFTGALTTLAATPCSAPFMSTALGFALTQSPLTAFIVMTFLAFGLALPYLVISFYPNLIRFMPKPGKWMELLKQVLAFPLFATVLWLLEVLAKQSGSNGVLALCSIFMLSYGVIWLFNLGTEKWFPKVSRIAFIGVLMFMIGSLLAGLKTSSMSDQKNLSPPWVMFDEKVLEKELFNQKTVFIDFTAEWCVTCKVNESLVLEHQQVKQALSHSSVVAMVGDWTNNDPVITRFLARYGRNSVPLYLVFKKGKKDPQVLPQILTKEMVLRALE